MPWVSLTGAYSVTSFYLRHPFKASSPDAVAFWDISVLGSQRENVGGMHRLCVTFPWDIVLLWWLMVACKDHLEL